MKNKIKINFFSLKTPVNFSLFYYLLLKIGLINSAQHANTAESFGQTHLASCKKRTTQIKSEVNFTDLYLTVYI